MPARKCTAASALGNQCGHPAKSHRYRDSPFASALCCTRRPWSRPNPEPRRSSARYPARRGCSKAMESGNSEERYMNWARRVRSRPRAYSAPGPDRKVGSQRSRSLPRSGARVVAPGPSSRRDELRQRLQAPPRDAAAAVAACRDWVEMDGPRAATPTCTIKAEYRHGTKKAGPYEPANDETETEDRSPRIGPQSFSVFSIPLAGPSLHQQSAKLYAEAPDRRVRTSRYG